MESGNEAPPPSSSPKNKSSSVLVFDALSQTASSAFSSSTMSSLTLTESTLAPPALVNSLISSSSSALTDKTTESSSFANSMTSSSVLSLSALASSTNSSISLSQTLDVTDSTSKPAQVQALISNQGLGTDQNCDSTTPLKVPDSSVGPESSIISESNVTLASSHQDDCNVLNSSETMSSEIATQAPAKFVPTLGAWAKPLLFKPPATPPEPSTPRDYDPAIVGNQLAALWPSLNDELLNKKPNSNRPTRTFQPPIEKLPPPELKADGKLRFPWAARLNPQSRNLYRAATPTYRLDGTPQISIPSKVLKLGPENKDEYIIGKFHRCSLPPGGLIHAVANRIWGRSCKISCKKIGESSYMFHIPHEPTRHWVIQRGVWHIDDCLLFVLPWTPEDSFKITELSTLPVWATLKNIPDCCYSRLGISHVASGLGEPILTHKPRLDPTTMGDAKVLVEMELDRDCDIPVVDIDVILQNGNASTTPSPPVHPQVNANLVTSTAASDTLVIQNQNLSNDLDDQALILPSQQPDVVNVQAITSGPSDHSHFQHETENSLFGTSSPSSSHSQQEKSATPPKSVSTLSTLVDSQSTPTDTQIMESFPSAIINNEALETSVVGPLTTPPIHCAFESPSRFTVLGDVDEVETEPSSSFNLTRGGRESKPPIKYQSLEWKTVRGRGKRGRRGRSSSH
ncbi:unnamed protein product [Brassica oleracea]